MKVNGNSSDHMTVTATLKVHGSVIPLSHYTENEIRTYYEHEMLKFVVKSVGNFSFSQIWAYNTTDVRT